MTTTDFTMTILVDKTPTEAFHAINDVRGWWSEEIKGAADKLNDVFKYHFEDIHRCQIKVIEFIPDEKIVWLVLDNYFKPGIFSGTSDPKRINEMPHHDEAEWVNTKISFEITRIGNKTQIRFAHLGLVPSYECFNVCSNGWTHYIQQSLSGLISTGNGQPNSTGKPMTSDEERFKASKVLK